MDQDKTKEIWITVEMGDGATRNMPKSKWSKAQDDSKWLIETAIKAGYEKSRAEELFSVRIVKEWQSTND